MWCWFESAKHKAKRQFVNNKTFKRARYLEEVVEEALAHSVVDAGGDNEGLKPLFVLQDNKVTVAVLLLVVSVLLLVSISWSAACK